MDFRSCRTFLKLWFSNRFQHSVALCRGLQFRMQSYCLFDDVTIYKIQFSIGLLAQVVSNLLTEGVIQFFIGFGYKTRLDFHFRRFLRWHARPGNLTSLEVL